MVICQEGTLKIYLTYLNLKVCFFIYKILFVVHCIMRETTYPSQHSLTRVWLLPLRIILKKKICTLLFLAIYFLYLYVGPRDLER